MNREIAGIAPQGILQSARLTCLVTFGEQVRRLIEACNRTAEKLCSASDCASKSAGKMISGFLYEKK